MRLLVLIAVTALSLAACRNDSEEQASRNAGTGLTAENIVANDITAIDAVTADAANMAADVNYADALAELTDNSDASAQPRSPERPKPRASAAPAAAPAPAPEAADSATNSE